MPAPDRGTALAVSRIHAPAALDSSGGAWFADLVRLGNDVARHDAGHDYLDQEPAEALGAWLDQSDRTMSGFAVERDGRIAGAVTISAAAEHDAVAAEFELLVDPARWGEGIEDALLAEAEREALGSDRPVLQTWTLHRPTPGGARLAPSTGWGSIPRDDRQTAFMLDHGFTLEQVERNSAFDLRQPVDRLERMRADARRMAGADYRPVAWTDTTPEEFVDSYAEVLSRMATDVPAGGMAIDEERWDADRVRRRDAGHARQRLLVSVVAIEHVPTGRLVAYNELMIGETRTAATQQYGTLVLREHRGHRLGMLVKCENLLRWRDLVPQSPRVSTFNAEENRPMLDVNEAIGFVPVSYAGAWKKRLG